MRSGDWIGVSWVIWIVSCVLFGLCVGLVRFMFSDDGIVCGCLCRRLCWVVVLIIMCVV